jgi:hypothetical protein
MDAAGFGEIENIHRPGDPFLGLLLPASSFGFYSRLFASIRG